MGRRSQRGRRPNLNHRPRERSTGTPREEPDPRIGLEARIQHFMGQTRQRKNLAKTAAVGMRAYSQPLIRGLWLACGLWLMVGGPHVWAQSQDAPSPAGETWVQISPAGKVTLERTGPMVQATMRLPLASVPPVIPPTASYLLTVPRDFRPARSVYWTMAARMVTPDGFRAATWGSPLTLQFWVVPDGSVYYQPLDAVPIPAGGAPLWVEGEWLWPVAGTSPLTRVFRTTVQ